MAYPYPQQGPPPPGFNQGYPGAQPYPQYGQPAGYPPYGTPEQPSYPQYPQPPPSHGGAMPGSYNTYPNQGMADNMAFTEKSIRNAFIRKVYSILMVQLAITCGFISIFVYHEPTKQYVQNSPGLFLLAFITTIVCLLAMACCEGPRRKTPHNYIFLFIFTIAESFLLGVVSSTYRANEVLLAVGICTVICFGLTVFAFQTKIDFTVMGGILFVAVLILFIFGLILIFFPGKTGRLIYACLGAFIFSVYLIYDTQLMIGGEHKYSISPEEYVFAALNLYIDIVNIFIYILSILGSSRD